jgi:hypothetical protein
MPTPSRHEQLLDEISARLRRVCPDMPEEHFRERVHEVARITYKYEGRATPTLNELLLMQRLLDAAPLDQ